MKTYHEMVQFIADQAEDRMRYNEWPAVMTVAEAYGISDSIVFDDVRFEKEFREKARKEKHKADARAANEQRRLANLAKWKEVS